MKTGRIITRIIIDIQSYHLGGDKASKRDECTILFPMTYLQTDLGNKGRDAITFNRFQGIIEEYFNEHDYAVTERLGCLGVKNP